MVSGTTITACYLMFIVMMLAGLADAAATFRSVEECPHRKEGNPLFRSAVHSGKKRSSYTSIVIKHLLGGAIACFALAQIHSPEIARIGVWAILIVGFVRVPVNLFMVVLWDKNLKDCRMGQHG